MAEIKQKQQIFTLQYLPSPTLWNLMASKKFVRGIRGPRGSGKSSGCCHEIFDWAKSQEPNTESVRKTRFAVIRNTYRELEDTTLKTWLDWFPEEVFGRINKQTMTHNIRLPLPDKTIMELEVLFRALDQPKDIKKLLSLELTGAYINEAREVPKGILDGLSDAVGRYPSRRDGGATQSGIIMDTNPPDDTHWWFHLEGNPPYDWEFFVQPGGLYEEGGEFVPNPGAENLENLEPNYYLRRAAGKDADHIRVYYCNQFGFVKDGKPVVPEYMDATHCTQESHDAETGVQIYVGLDFGLTPAAVFAQYSSMGRWYVFDELATEDMGAVRFAELLGQKLRGEYREYEFEIYGDPAGDERSQVDERTPFMILAAAGIEAHRAPTNDFVVRREAIAEPLGRLALDGKPRLLISPRCHILRKGLAGGYHYRRLQVRGIEQYRERPTKNRYSHLVDALGYLLLGAGEGRRIVESKIHPKLDMTVQVFDDELDRHPDAWMII